MAAMHVLMICGAPGAGKSETLAALADALSQADVRHAAFDWDAVTRAHPPLLATAAFEQAGLVAGGFRAAGHQFLLVSATIESQWSLNALLDALGATERFVVRLEAAPETLEQRIRQREPSGWSGLEALLAKCRPLAATHAKLEVDLALSSEEHAPAEIIRRIRAATGR